MKRFAFVILNYNVLEETAGCIESIRKIDYEEKQIVVVDNASANQDEFFAVLKEKYKNERNITFLRSKKNTGYARGNNIGIHYAKNVLRADFVCILNPDVTIQQADFADKCIDLYRQYDYSVLGPRLLGGV